MKSVFETIVAFAPFSEIVNCLHIIVFQTKLGRI